MSLVDTAKIGRKGGNARAANLSAEERSAGASAASKARWDKYRLEHPKPPRKIAKKRKNN